MGVTLTIGSAAGDAPQLSNYLDHLTGFTQEDAGGGTTQFLGNDGRLLDSTLMTTETNGEFSNEIDFGHIVVGAKGGYGLELEATMIGTINGEAAGQFLQELVSQGHVSEANMEKALLSGDDTILAPLYGAANLNGEGGDDVMYGGSNGGTLEGASGNDVITAGNDSTHCIGDNGDDQLTGGNGRDTLDGGSGDDVLKGGADSDLLIGGSGANVFVYSDAKEGKTGGWGKDVIADFTHQDKLDFSGASAIHSMPDLTITYGTNEAFVSDGTPNDTINVFLKFHGHLDSSNFIFGSSSEHAAGGSHLDPHPNFATPLHGLEHLAIA